VKTGKFDLVTRVRSRGDLASARIRARLPDRVAPVQSGPGHSSRLRCRWASFLFVRMSDDHKSAEVEYEPKGIIMSD